MPHLPRSTADRLLPILRRAFPDYAWDLARIDVLPAGERITPEGVTAIPPMYWCAIGLRPAETVQAFPGAPYAQPLWVLGTESANAVLRKGSLGVGRVQGRAAYVHGLRLKPTPAK